MNRRPRILITLDTGTMKRRGVSMPTVDAKRAYGEQVAESGGTPLFVAPTEDADVIDALAATMDGLVITGGDFDIPPDAYGEQAGDRRLDAPKADRTSFEGALFARALDRRCPVLGVCGGMQLMNVVLGGSLLVDIGTDQPDALEHEQPTSPMTTDHPLQVLEGTAWHERVGNTQHAVNSTHHQAVDRVADRLQVWATAPDGIVEAVEDRTDPAVIGVQWHPELLADDLCRTLYGTLVAAAQRRMV